MSKIPLPFRFVLLLVALPAIALVAGLVLFPSSPFWIPLLFLIVFAVVGFGIYKMLDQPDLEKAPGRNPVEPPSVS